MARSSAKLRDVLRVKPGTRVNLSKVDPGATHGHAKASSSKALDAERVAKGRA